MSVSSPVRTLGWQKRSAAVSVLLAMEDHRRDVGARIRALREQAGLSQEDLAHAAGVTTKTISRWENGRHAGYMANIRQLANALGVESKDILGQPPAPLGLGETSQLDRIEAKLDRLLTILGGAEVADLVDATGEDLAALLGTSPAPSQAEPSTADTAGAKQESRRARSRATRRNA